MDFTVLKIAVAEQWKKMQRHQMFRSKVEKDDLWAAYLKAFPAGTNELYRERTEHDCGCCKQFIRAVGDALAVIDGKLVSVWDVKVSEPGYQVVADALAALSKSKGVADTFLHYERTAGTDKSFEKLVDRTAEYKHFFVNIDAKFVLAKADIATKLSEVRSGVEVFERALREITPEATATVLELIAQNSLYRGEEQKFAVSEFAKAQREYRKLTSDEQRSNYAWTANAHPAVQRIRNSAIGTLLVNLSEGMDIEGAVKAFEVVVAPANYKRPKALITQRMIDDAKAKLEELGLTSALDRRYAKITDISVGNVLFADRTARKAMTGTVLDDLVPQTAATVKNLDKVEEVPIDRFITEILPKAETLEVMFNRDQSGNLVSLVAPVDPTAGGLFKWGNNFSWSYNGEVADSIKERVKKAGGSVVGDLCCRLAWHNLDDLDFHMVEPGGYEIYYGNRHIASPSGGRLDVDMNAGVGVTREPVENIFYASRTRMKEGQYRLGVHQFTPRESSDVGFEVEFDWMGDVKTFSYPQAMSRGSTIQVIKFNYSKANGIEVVESLPHGKSSHTLWGVQTNTFVKVKAMMMSPNFWDDKSSGNKHYFFMLDGCVNDGTARGFFNEFLKPSLEPHRKVFEVLGSKMIVPASDDQLSGLGFSSTQKNTLLCRVKGAFSRVIKIVF